jgi:transposase
MAKVDPRRLVFIDESGANLAMSRSHVWVPRGTEYVEPRPMNWGSNLTMTGAIRVDGWLTLGTSWNSANGERFSAWVRRHLAPKLHQGDIVVLDNLSAHKDPRALSAIEARGASVRFLPPYSPDLNPIEPGWGIVKKRIRAVAPRSPAALRSAAHHAHLHVRPRHCRRWFAHAGYVRRPN